MPTYRVEFTRSAKREFDRLPQRMQERVVEACGVLTMNPFSDLLRIKKLKGAAALYRVRIGDHRLVYEVRQQLLLVVIIKIGHRREVYRHL